MQTKSMHGLVVNEMADLLNRLNFAAKANDFRFSKPVQDRYEALIDQKKEGLLTEDESVELELILVLNDIFYTAKIKSLQPLAAKAA